MGYTYRVAYKKEANETEMDAPENERSFNI